jgi:hypothetical protein
MDCAIKDISPTGAQLRVQPGSSIPDNVYLVHVSAWTAFEAIVKWRRKDGSIGLKFKTAHDLERPTTGELKRMRLSCLDRGRVGIPHLG